MTGFKWKKPRGVNRVSSGQADAIERRVRPRDAQLREVSYCEARREGAPGNCYGGLTVHEPWTRARGGPIDDRRNMRTVCSQHNRAISQDADTMAWAYEHNFIVKADDGPAWLDVQPVRETD